MELCPMCGAETREGDAHCSQCGAPLDKDEAELWAAERELARPRDGAGTQTWGVFLWIGMVLSVLGAFGALVGGMLLYGAFGCWVVIAGGVAFLQNIAIAALFDAVIDLRKKAGLAPAPTALPRLPPREERP